MLPCAAEPDHPVLGGNLARAPCPARRHPTPAWHNHAMNVTLHTNLGDINITMFPDHAPKTVANFVGLANGTLDYKDDAGRKNPTPYYDGLTFHRVIPGFMIQGGCPQGSGMGGPGYAFNDEISPDKNFSKPY